MAASSDAPTNESELLWPQSIDATLNDTMPWQLAWSDLINTTGEFDLGNTFISDETTGNATTGPSNISEDTERLRAIITDQQDCIDEIQMQKGGARDIRPELASGDAVPDARVTGTNPSVLMVDSISFQPYATAVDNYNQQEHMTLPDRCERPLYGSLSFLSNPWPASMSSHYAPASDSGYVIEDTTGRSPQSNQLTFEPCTSHPSVASGDLWDPQIDSHANSSIELNIMNSTITFANPSTFGDAAGANGGIVAPSQSDITQRIVYAANECSTGTSRTRPNKTRRKYRFPEASIAILDDWFFAHHNSPYPSEQQKRDLIQRSGLSRKQVDTWFNNARRRQKDSSAGLGPMESWLYSSSEDEAARIEDILQASMSSPTILINNDTNEFSSTRRSYNAFSSASSFGSAFDDCPEARICGPPKQGRKQYSFPANSRSSSMSSYSSASSMIETNRRTLPRGSFWGSMGSDDKDKLSTWDVSSGSSKIKARRRKKAANKRSKLSQAAMEAEVEGGSDIDVFKSLDSEGAQSLMVQFSSKDSSSSQKKHKCTVCSKEFTRLSALQTHINLHTGKKPYACDSPGCGKHFSVMSNLRRHRKVHESDGDHCICSIKRQRLFQEQGLGSSESPLWDMDTENNNGTEGASATLNVNQASAESQDQFQFQCTFCHMKISPRSWKRHEESQHHSNRQWVCMPSEHSSLNSDCVFCGKSQIDPSHNSACKHRVQDCLKRSAEVRTFNRKDKLVQHVKEFHSCVLKDEVLGEWASDTRDYDRIWDCGFCDVKLNGWDERARHIAAHFREGKDMSMWRASSLPVQQMELLSEQMSSILGQGLFPPG